MNSGEIPVCETDFPNRGPIYINQVDDTIWQAGFFEYAHEHLRRIYLCIGWLPYHNVAAHCCGRWKVSANGSEIKGRYRQNKSFKRPILHAVVHARAAYRLLPVDITQIMNIKSQEIYQFTRAVNFCLVCILALSQHGSTIHIRTVSPCD